LFLLSPARPQPGGSRSSRPRIGSARAALAAPEGHADGAAAISAVLAPTAPAARLGMTRDQAQGKWGAY
ncbi:hypothetical protein N9L68_09065, partial [bacterium]|nr:hypothetical protein [bacterium]